MKNKTRDAIRDGSRKWLLGERDETTHYDKPSSRLAHQIIGVLARLEEKGVVKVIHSEDDAAPELLEVLKEWTKDNWDCGCDTASCKQDCLPARSRHIVAKTEGRG